MNKKEPHIDPSKVKDLATEAAIKSLMPQGKKSPPKELKHRLSAGLSLNQIALKKYDY